ncbi:hypothetical protein D3OALGA1CA_3934 [Olavius algarvensis associated proteobacterium Delta 3]|nr:hypothetical protein D3OALGB2SA_2118 [Olavius algarvensis associated proteobacterium Delta 3]CAB5142467.1 hypothetical protein D3OALGA1CA_3934 [Olavius algarvensis associated proteobacterium Delta 3]
MTGGYAVPSQSAAMWMYTRKTGESEVPLPSAMVAGTMKF